jgi:glycosyltransferase involved in cell wall biosynthesis
MADLVFISNKWKENSNFLITIFTSTYNRINTIGRTYQSLINLKNNQNKEKQLSFEWIIVDDGSQDHTSDIAKSWCTENKLPIRYYRQENQGKHIAMNFAVQHAKGMFFISIDSDDTILPNALRTFIETWNSIENKSLFAGVAARCIDETGQIIGKKLPQKIIDCSYTDLHFKYNISVDMLEMYKTEILKKYPFPLIDARVRFCPECIIWHEISKKYLLRYIDSPTLTYYKDTNNAITKGNSSKRAIANYYMWVYIINNLSSYIIYNPKEIIKSYIGISMDGFRSKKTIKEILSDIHNFKDKILTLLFTPLGKLMTKI